jgi:hypothetical protein
MYFVISVGNELASRIQTLKNAVHQEIFHHVETTACTRILVKHNLCDQDYFCLVVCKLTMLIRLQFINLNCPVSSVHAMDEKTGDILCDR